MSFNDGIALKCTNDAFKSVGELGLQKHKIELKTTMHFAMTQCKTKTLNCLVQISLTIFHSD